ncbi:hypothetical protein [Paraprevotella xylaniphila]|uniref:Uncharacterized protein n=1 Tax=Siphoviridae sp. ctr8v12 TaxID=2825685 RepID=A0A8S5QGH1_9CAUD|nr:hypothetical protein [Paraprevotella xylaniphila]DAE17971.1 MAG TPA: hypothetical protein [Siphoviridae sp. ctr8v12]
MDIQELNSVIADFVQVGYMQAVKAYEPPQDLVRASEIKLWLKMMRIDIKRFNRLVSEGVIRATRKGVGRNSPLYYSKAEVKQALSMANIAGIVARGTMK